MRDFLRALGPRALAFGAGALVFAGGAGFLTSLAMGAHFQTPTTTVTISVGTGPQGPPGPIGPQGPPGPSGAFACPGGSTFGKVVFNAPGGQTAIYACIAG